MSDFSALTTMPQHLRRLKMAPEKLRALQESRLRKLLRLAKKHSTFHADRLGSLDPEGFRLEDMHQLPRMTKPDVLDNFDHIVTDPRITMKGAFDHLRQHGGDALMFDRYKVVTSAGSSGRVGVWVYDRQGWRDLQAANMRMSIRDYVHHPLDLLHKPTIAVVAAANNSHLSVQAAQGFSNGFVRLLEIPVSAPFREIIARLEETQPLTLSGYPSVLAELARASLEGSLSIRPRRVVTSAEPLLQEQRATMEQAWGITVANVWAASEGGPLAVGCFQEAGMHLTEDQIIFEPLSEDGTACPPGQPADKVLITNIFNHALPLIRYELEDRITLIDRPCRCGSTLRRIADIQGRFDELFDYGHGIKVHTHVFRSALYQLESNMTDYQIFQTKRGVRIILRTKGRIDVSGVEAELAQRLRSQGLHDPEVLVDLDAELRRLPSGKLKRNVPLGFEGLEDDRAA